MPYTINGVGTHFYGSRDEGPDGSYITTEWLVVIYIPLLPLRSMRVLPLASDATFPFSSSQRFMSRPTRLNWRQVLNVYLVLFLIPLVPAALLFLIQLSGCLQWLHSALRSVGVAVYPNLAPLVA